MFIRINQQIAELLRKSEGETALRMGCKVDAANCLPWEELKTFMKSLPEKRQAEFAGLIKFEDLIMEVQHKNEMKIHNESEDTKRLREKLKLKREKREIYKLTGRKLDPGIPGDLSLKAYETSVKFAMSYLFAVFTSSIGGYFAAKVFFGFDYASSLLFAGVMMFLTVMIEVGLYITKTLKSDLITQKANRVINRSEEKRFDDYYNRVKTAKQFDSQTSSEGHLNAPKNTVDNEAEIDVEEVKMRNQKDASSEKKTTSEPVSKKEK